MQYDRRRTASQTINRRFVSGRRLLCAQYVPPLFTSIVDIHHRVSYHLHVSLRYADEYDDDDDDDGDDDACTIVMMMMMMMSDD